MFEKCIKCTRMGESCVPNLMLLEFPRLMDWCTKRQHFLGWSTQTLAEKSNVPIGTLTRVKAGDYSDCKYSTIRNLLITLIGGTKDEFHCTEEVANELRQIEKLEREAAMLPVVEAENEKLKARLYEIDELHRKDIHIVKEEYMAQIKFLMDEVTFLKDELKAWHSK